MGFSTVKTYAAATAEAAPTAALANYVTIPGIAKNRYVTRLMEFRLGGSPATGGSPTAVHLDLYRFNPETSNQDYLSTWTINPTDITNGRVPTIVVETWGNEIQTRLRFDGGTSPTFTGRIDARALE